MVMMGEATLALLFVFNGGCDSWKRAYSQRPLLFGVSCELLKLDELQRYVLWAMLGAAFCAHLLVLIVFIVVRIQQHPYVTLLPL